MTDEIFKLVRATAHLAWADGRLAPQEKAMLERFYSKLGLTPEECEKALAEPPSEVPDFSELAAVIPGEAGRARLMKLLRDLSNIDNDFSPEEQDIVNKIAAALGVEASG